MPDYTRATGNAGTMLIRDTGSIVEFWLYAPSPTYNHQLPWAGFYNGVNIGPFIYDFVGGAWRKLASLNVVGSQNVVFNLGRSGTSGLGGPTDFTVYINRTSRPSPPSTPQILSITDTAIAVQFADGANNGAAIDAREIWYGTIPTPGAQYGVPGTPWLIGLLAKGTLYYFWGRTHNALGWSDWSPAVAARTLREPDAPSVVSYEFITQNSVYAKFSYTEAFNGGTPILETQFRFSRSLAQPGNIVSAYSFSRFINLDAGKTYYFWARTRNAIGWSPWTSPTSVTLKAGAFVMVGGVPTRAVPYFNVNGVWTLAMPSVRLSGYWKETQ